MKQIAVPALAVIGLLCLTLPAAATDKPAAASPGTKAAHRVRATHVPRPETLSGKIAQVDPGMKLLVVDDSTGVPFDLVVTSKTHIRYKDENLDLNSLSLYKDKPVSIQFLPERSGDIATSIEITG